MFHPLIRLLISRPDLLAAHVAGYADLVGAQLTEAVVSVRAKAMLLVSAVVFMLFGLMFSGVAVLLAASIPVQHMPAAWLLWVTPAVPLLAALVCWLLAQRHSAGWDFKLVKEQVAADALLFKRVSDAA